MPAPDFVSPPPPLMAPENVVLVPSPPAVSVAVPSVTLPAPASEPIDCAKLLRLSVAPAATVNALADENALTAPARSVPVITSVLPEYVRAPENLSLPATERACEPPPLMAPENVVLVPSPPAVSVAVPSVTLPAPASEPIDCAKLLRLSVAPVATVTALAGDKVFVAPACSMPAFTFVAPL